VARLGVRVAVVKVVKVVKVMILFLVDGCLVSMDEAAMDRHRKESIIAGSRLYLSRLVVRFVSA
jgi:hypothetical protein